MCKKTLRCAAPRRALSSTTCRLRRTEFTDRDCNQICRYKQTKSAFLVFFVLASTALFKCPPNKSFLLISVFRLAAILLAC